MAQQTWNSKDYDQNARFVTDMGMGLVDLLAPQPGERILDLGRGDGILTKKLADLDCFVVGVDASPDFIQSAKNLGLDARLMDGEALSFTDEFDAVFSNAALHWMKQKEKVI
jgi:trans-aconitate methyltransferase